MGQELSSRPHLWYIVEVKDRLKLAPMVLQRLVVEEYKHSAKIHPVFAMKSCYLRLEDIGSEEWHGGLNCWNR